MRSTNIYSNIEKAVSIRISQRHSWFVYILSMPSSTIRLINFKLLPPPQAINDCNNISIHEQANVNGDRLFFFAPVRSQFHIESFVAGYFICKGRVFLPDIH